MLATEGILGPKSVVVNQMLGCFPSENSERHLIWCINNPLPQTSSLLGEGRQAKLAAVEFELGAHRTGVKSGKHFILCHDAPLKQCLLIVVFKMHVFTHTVVCTILFNHSFKSINFL